MAQRDQDETHEEKARRLGVPLIPKRTTPSLPGPNPVQAVCGECGIELHRVMGYVCPKMNCPTGLGPTLM